GRAQKRKRIQVRPQCDDLAPGGCPRDHGFSCRSSAAPVDAGVINHTATASSQVTRVARMAAGLRTARMRKKPTLLVTRQRRSNENRKKQEGRSLSWTGIESKETGNNSRAEPRRSGVGSPTTTSTSSKGGKTSSRARFRNATALPRTRPKRMSTLGSSHCRDHPGPSCDQT